MKRAALAALLMVPTFCKAGTFLLDQPVDCTLGRDCYIQQYVDHDSTKAFRDYRCAGLSYDGHKGTDFGLPTREAMDRGVSVLAAAPGIVRGVRDGMEDVEYTGDDLDGRDCGNGIVLRHGDDWETQYCHLKKGSVAVHKGQRVTAGQVLGEIGLSGRTQFPHLHLSVRRRGSVIDPFAPSGAEQCGSETSLWRVTPEYRPGALLDIGFAQKVPAYGDVKSGSADDTPPNLSSRAIVGYGYAYGGQAGDTLQISITGPDGEIVDHKAEIDKAQALFFRAAGRKKPKTGWPAGVYHLNVSMVRNGLVLSHLSEFLTLR